MYYNIEILNFIFEFILIHFYLFIYFFFRTSLNWKKIVHGRAYGDGVYHSLQAQTSSSYAGAYYRYDTGAWKNSMLSVQKCMALSEIVNRPDEFTR
jgi:ubiquitin-conjugating enzyme E2 Q